MNISISLTPQDSWDVKTVLINLAAAVLLALTALALFLWGGPHFQMVQAGTISGGQGISVGLNWNYILALTMSAWWIISWLHAFSVRRFLMRGICSVAETLEFVKAVGGTNLVLAYAMDLPTLFGRRYSRWYALAVWREGETVQTCQVHGRGVAELGKFRLAKQRDLRAAMATIKTPGVALTPAT
jgi:hypothetical protein